MRLGKCHLLVVVVLKLTNSDIPDPKPKMETNAKPTFFNPQSRKTKSKPIITKFKPHITNHNYWQPEQQKTWWPRPKPMLPESKNKTVTAITNQCISIVPANLLTLKVPNKMPDYVWFLEGKSKYSSIIIMWSNVHNKKHIKTICPTFQFEV